MIEYKSKEDIKKMRKSGNIAASILKQLSAAVRPGATTRQLNDMAEKLIAENNVKPAFRGQYGFPASVCASVNNVVVHGVPNDNPLQKGDILSLDFGVIYEGWYSDTAVTLPVGEISYEARHLVKVTKKALRLGIKQAKLGSTTGDIGNTIQRYVESEGYSVVLELAGHGLGRTLHQPPEVPNWGNRGEGTPLKEGMVIAIEPMVIVGNPDIKLDEDGFSYKTVSGKLSAHFEHTVAITKKGPRILTKA